MRPLTLVLAGSFAAGTGLFMPMHIEPSQERIRLDPPPLEKVAPPNTAIATTPPAAPAAGDAVSAIDRLAPAAPPSDSIKEGTRLAYAAVPEAAAPAATPPAAISPALPPAAVDLSRPAPPPGIDLTGLADAVALYRKGDLAGGDALARRHSEPLARTMLEWTALRTNPRDSGYARTVAFLETHADWPSAPWLRIRAEEELYFDPNRDPALVIAYFDKWKPLGSLGKLALARAFLKKGRTAEATALVRDVWREYDFSAPGEALVLKEFGSLVTREDHQFRAERLLYKEASAAGMRAADRVGGDEQALARARAAVIANANTAMTLLDALPASAKKLPGYIFARGVALRRADKLADAAALLLTAPQDANALVDGDSWWAEARLLARKLLDKGDAKTAYRLCAQHWAESADAKSEAEFHAGWIALRFLKNADLAAGHFARAAAVAEAPADAARATYWQARAATAMGQVEAATKFYERAADEPTSFYGQLAQAKLGRVEAKIRQAADVKVGDARQEAVRVVELLYAIGAGDFAQTLVVDAAQHLAGEADVAALGAVTSAYQDARATLLVGKLAAARGGFKVDNLAFPTFGIPMFTPAARSADRAVVYAIARQESAFEPTAVSSSGAKGLMQLLSSTAREIARRVGVEFDEAKLTRDAAFNAKLGAAYLGSLIDGERGSLILAIASYNAGAGRVQKWISTYGDPRDPNVDPVDWIELIPFDETRHYVQQVMENLEVYRLRFGERTAMPIEADLRSPASNL